MDSGDIVLMMRSKNPDMLALFFSLPFLLELLTHLGKKEKKLQAARGRDIYCFEETGFLRSTFQLNDAFGRPFPTRVRNAVPISSTLYHTTVRFSFFFFCFRFLPLPKTKPLRPKIYISTQERLAAASNQQTFNSPGAECPWYFGLSVFVGKMP